MGRLLYKFMASRWCWISWLALMLSAFGWMTWMMVFEPHIWFVEQGEQMMMTRQKPVRTDNMYRFKDLMGNEHEVSGTARVWGRE